MPDIEIKRGYEVLPDNNVRFGIRITNTSDLAISGVEVILDFPESLFKLKGDKIQKFSIIPPANSRTAEFILKPLGCVHQVNIEALISYRDPKYEKHVETMLPKEVHCVCPFLKGRTMTKAEFLEFSGSGYSAEMGLNFQDISVGHLVSFLDHTCKSRHYKVDDFSIDSGRMLYLASESIGEKTYYLLTALIKEDEGLTKVMLRAVSDKPHGLNGFLNEIVTELRHVVSTVQSAREIGIIKKEQVINIIDSVVQRTTFGGEGVTSVNIKGSVVQRTNFKADEERKTREEERLRREEEERLQKEKEEQERHAREGAERKQREEAERREAAEREQKAREEREKQARLESERREQERLRKQKEIQKRITPSVKEKKPLTKYLALVLVLGMLVLGYVFMNSGPKDTTENIQSIKPVEVSAAAGEVSRDGLVGEWHFDGDARDSSGNGNDGTVYGASFVEGKVGKALSFDGSNDYAEVLNTDILKSQNSLTVSAWIKVDVSSTSSLHYFINTNGFGVWKRNDQMGLAISLPHTNSTRGQIETNTWQQIVGTYDGTLIKFYVNGELKGFTNWPGTMSFEGSRNTVIGTFNGEYWNGTIDEVRIYNRALNAEEIKANYEGSQATQ